MRRPSSTRPVRLAALLFTALAAVPLAAQERDGMSVELGADGAGISLYDQDSEWWMGRVQVSGHRARGGAYLAVESLRRWERSDTAFLAGGHVHGGRWTFVAQAGGTPGADFYFRTTAEAELLRDVGGGWVVHAGYRYFEFPGAKVHLASPAVTWYTARGEAHLRTYLGRNTTLHDDSWSILARGLRDVGQRWRLGGGFAVGERLFDVTSLAGVPAPGWIVFAEARHRIGSNASVGAVVRVAHEGPDFRQVGLTLNFATGLR